jgi:uncharacterized protein YukE
VAAATAAAVDAAVAAIDNVNASAAFTKAMKKTNTKLTDLSRALTASNAAAVDAAVAATDNAKASAAFNEAVKKTNTKLTDLSRALTASNASNSAVAAFTTAVAVAGDGKFEFYSDDSSKKRKASPVVDLTSP